MISARTVRAQSRPTLAGTWSATPITERWNIGDWGEACGPKPSESTVPGGQVTIREEGAELAMAGAGHPFRTKECWEQLPGLTPNSHSVASRMWRTRCASGPGDPRQATVVTTLTATDSTLTFDETGEYQFRMQGQNCTASVRRSRSFTLVQRLGEAPVTATPIPSTRTDPPAPQPEPAREVPPAQAAPPPSERCAVSGEPARVEVRPAHKVLRPGEKFTFRSTVLDARGCPVDIRPTWTITTPGAKVTISPWGSVAVADDATDGHVDLLASIEGRGVRLGIEVATPARYEALLASAQTDGGEAEESAVAVVATGNVGGSMAIAEDKARTRKTLFVLIVGGLALGLAGFGFVMMRRASANAAREEAEDADVDPGTGAAPAPAPPVAAPGRGAAPAFVCPSCRNEFPAGSGFCPNDGNRLVPVVDPKAAGPLGISPGGICPTCGRGYDPGVKVCPVHGEDLVPVGVYRAAVARAASPVQRGKICPSCGGRYAGDATFCGKDGTALVLVN
jgi:hypothetical protein